MRSEMGDGRSEIEPAREAAAMESRVIIAESRVTSHEVSRTTPVDVERTETMRSQDGIDVSVLVPARDEAENLSRFMELASASLGGGSLRYEVIVIDDGSADSTPSVLVMALRT